MQINGKIIVFKKGVLQVIRSKIIRSFNYGYFNWLFPNKNTIIPDAMELDQFIADVGYQNIKQILVNNEHSGTRYTILYEDGRDALPPYKLCPRCHAQLKPADTQCNYCYLKNIP